MGVKGEREQGKGKKRKRNDRTGAGNTRHGQVSERSGKRKLKKRKNG